MLSMELNERNEPEQTQTQREQNQADAVGVVSIQGVEPESQTKPSITPSIAESERLFKFFNVKFNLGIALKDLIVLIHETHPNIKGFFRAVGCSKSWVEDLSFKHQNPDQEGKPEVSPINSITLSSHNLQVEPYETLTHEFAHYLNTISDHYKGNANNYHTAEFKKRAEQLGLRVERGSYGFNLTNETDEFKKMITDEFKPDPDAFKIFQETDEQRAVRIGISPLFPYGMNPDGTPAPKPEPKGRLIKWVCECGVIVRASRTGKDNKPFKAICCYCQTEFKPEDEQKPRPVKPEVPLDEPSEDEEKDKNGN